MFLKKLGWSFLILLIFICLQSKFDNIKIVIILIDNIKIVIILINYGFALKYTHTTDLALLFDTVA